MTATATLPAVPLHPDLAKKLQVAALKQQRYTQERDELVCKAVMAGASYREIGQLIRMSHTGVKRIVDRSKVIAIRVGNEELTLREAIDRGVLDMVIETDPDQDHPE